MRFRRSIIIIFVLGIFFELAWSIGWFALVRDGNALALAVQILIGR